MIKKIVSIILLSLCLLIQEKGLAQGCVAIRGLGGSSCLNPNEAPDSTSWTLTMNSRYFKSYKHFVGVIEQKERVENETEVINHNFSTDFFIQKNISKRISFGLNIPLISNGRSSLYEHAGNAAGPASRKSTHSFGLGDVRFAAYAWLRDPGNMPRWNVQVGLGLKLPTGDYQYSDYFYKNDTTKTLGPVDQSIQLGDGGTGMTVEFNSFYAFSHKLSAYGGAYYLSSPREQNGVSTARGGVVSAASIAYGSNVMSVPDQYMYRFGLSYMGKHLTTNLGIRKDGLPAVDMIGGSNGFRRPGYVVAVEPGLSYRMKSTIYFINLPFAIQRNRTQSMPDKIRSQKTGVYFRGDAAFADYLVNIGMVIKF